MLRRSAIAPLLLLVLGTVEPGCRDVEPRVFQVRLTAIDAHGGPSLSEDRVQAILRRSLERVPSFGPEERDRRSGRGHDEVLAASLEYRELPDAADNGRDLLVRMFIEPPEPLAAELGPDGLDVTVLLERKAGEADMAAARLVLRSNFEGPAGILGLIANRFEARGSGTIVGISSVAGDRGRATNYVYGSAKAGFTAWLSGLRNRLAGTGVHVLTVKPGFVATAMTEGMDLPERLTAQPQAVGRAVLRAVRARRNVIYVKPVWRLAMLVIRSIPEAVFKKLRI